MVYYLDSDFCLHVSAAEGYTPWEDVDGYFDGKCRAYVESYRIVPAGETWNNGDRDFTGPMMTPLVEPRLLMAVQDAYDQGREEAEQQQGVLLELTELVSMLAMGDTITPEIAADLGTEGGETV